MKSRQPTDAYAIYTVKARLTISGNDESNLYRIFQDRSHTGYKNVGCCECLITSLVHVTTPISLQTHHSLHLFNSGSVSATQLWATRLLPYLLTPWCRVLLKKLTGLQIVKKFPAFYGTRRFITALTSLRHLSLSWASPFQSIYPHLTSWRSILILSTHLRLGLPSGLFSSGFPTETLYTPRLLPKSLLPFPATFSMRFRHSQETKFLYPVCDQS